MKLVWKPMNSAFLVATNLVLCVFGTPNYFVDYFDDTTGVVGFPYPIGQCALTSILGQYVKYECAVDNSGITKYDYGSDDTCTTVDSITLYDMSDIASNGLYDFNCNGTNDYVVMELSLGDDTCAAVFRTTISITNVCHYAGNGTSQDYSITTCDGDCTAVNSWKGTNCDGDPTSTFEASTECTFFMSTLADFYTKMAACVMDDEAQSSTGETKQCDSGTTTIAPDDATTMKPVLDTTTIAPDDTTTVTYDGNDSSVESINLLHGMIVLFGSLFWTIIKNY